MLPVTPGIATAGRFLFGGCGLAAAVTALESVTGRPLVWATGQYLSFAMVDEIVDFDVTIASDGHYTSQARVVAHVEDREILTVNAALGSRPLEWDAAWERPPECIEVEPSSLRRRVSRWDVTDTIMERMEIRLADAVPWEELGGGMSATGRSALWIRLPGVDMSAGVLSIIGDYVPFGIAQAVGSFTRSNSLDNTVRIVRVVPTEWVLADIRVHGVREGFGHGLVHLWSEDGTLLATASQSAVVRPVSESG